MGIRKKIIKKLPIFGRGQAAAVERAKSAPVPRTREATEPQEPPKPKHPRGEMDTTAYIEKVISENRVVLFMKGEPSQPLCGFSANAAGILSSTGHDFVHVDVIADHEIREAIKNYSQWPTLPQIYVDNEFLGGADILRQMSTDGSLLEILNGSGDTATE